MAGGIVEDGRRDAAVTEDSVRYKAVIFDLIGTLIDGMPVIPRPSTNAFLRTFYQ